MNTLRLFVTILLTVVVLTQKVVSQAIPIAAGKVSAAQQSPPNSQCPADTYCRIWLPLNRGDVSIKAIHDFFNSGTSNISFLNQVQYLYGFGGGTNSLSSDMIGGATGFGMHGSVGTTVTATPSTSSTPNNSVPITSPTPEQAIQQLETGGELYIKGLWPIVNVTTPAKTDGNSTLIIAVQPKLNLNFNGFGGQNTLTEATEYNWNGSLIGNYQYPFNPDNASLPVSFYADGQFGYQGVLVAFARQVGLDNKLNFLLSQVTFGFNFAGFRIGGQRFFGPAAAYGATGVNNFSKWHLVLQFSPHAQKS
jgi:hypothetical protein